MCTSNMVAKREHGMGTRAYERLLPSLYLGDAAPSGARGARAPALRRRGTRTRHPTLYSIPSSNPKRPQSCNP